jgi:hypothetical protein
MVMGDSLNLGTIIGDVVVPFIEYMDNCEMHVANSFVGVAAYGTPLL